MTKRNNSKLSYVDCCMKLISDEPFENLSTDDLDSIYYVAFKRWAYHLTRGGYLRFLYQKREQLTVKI